MISGWYRLTAAGGYGSRRVAAGTADQQRQEVAAGTADQAGTGTTGTADQWRQEGSSRNSRQMAAGR